MPTEDEIIAEARAYAGVSAAGADTSQEVLKRARDAVRIVATMQTSIGQKAGDVAAGVDAAAAAAAEAGAAKDFLIAHVAGMSPPRPWDILDAYVVGDQVTYTAGTATSTYYAQAPSQGKPPPDNPTEWLLLSAAGQAESTIAAQEAAAAAEAAAEAVAADAQAVDTAATVVEADRQAVDTAAVTVEAARAQVAANTTTVTASVATVQAAETATAAAAILADTRATDAEAAATSAELSAAAAATNGQVYASTAAGLAATTNGQTFWVEGSGDSITDLYRNVSGVATYLGSWKAQSAVDAELDDARARIDGISGGLFGGLGVDVGITIVNEAGQLVAQSPDIAAHRTMRGDVDGLLENADQAIISGPVNLPYPYGGQVVIVSADGRFSQSASSGGGGGDAVPAIAWEAVAGDDLETDPTYTLWSDDVDTLVLVEGQSYAEGGDEEVGQDPYSQTARDSVYGLMPSPGMQPNGADFDTYVPLRATGNNETVLPEMVDTILQHMQTVFGEKRPVIGAIAASSGKSYLDLKRGTATYNEGLRIVERCVAASELRGRGLQVPYVVIHHGQTDNQVAPWAYKAILSQWRQNFEEDIWARGARQVPLRVICSIPTRNPYSGAVRLNGPAIAMRELARERPDLFTISTADYGVRHVGNHPSIAGFRMLGKFDGIAWCEHFMGSGWTGCDVRRLTITGPRTVRLDLDAPFGGAGVADRTGALVGYPASASDAAYIGPPPGGSEASGRDGGFWIRDERTGASAIGVVSAAVSAASVTLTFSRDFEPGAMVLSYASRPQSVNIAGDNSVMARGIVRGDVEFTMEDSDESLFHWLLPFEIRF